MPVLAGTEHNIAMVGGCQNLRQTTTFTGSTLNDAYGNVIKEIGSMSNQRRQLGQQFAKSINNPQAAQATVDRLAKLDQKQMAYLDTLKNQNPYLARVAALGTYPSFQNNKGNFNNEIDYFATNYFQFQSKTHPSFVKYGNQFLETNKKGLGLKPSKKINLLGLTSVIYAAGKMRWLNSIQLHLFPPPFYWIKKVESSPVIYVGQHWKRKLGKF